MNTTTGQAVRFAPEGELSIYTAAEHKPHLLRVLDEADIAELDLSKVSLLDTAGLQLLVMAKKEALLRGKPLSVIGHSPAVIEVIDLANLSGFFGDHVFIPSSAKGGSEQP
ncbi:MAG TPA: STAS domain-containing protein [Candidatus Acidoferrum sp.]|nr:STAS domain-containing protein [Candidatus Acidoferrum sp.]